MKSSFGLPRCLAAFAAVLLLLLSPIPLSSNVPAAPDLASYDASPSQGSGWEGRGTGFVPPPDGVRNEQYARSAPMALSAVPPSIDLSSDPWFPAVGDQGDQGSCSAWAMAYYCYGYQEAKDNGWTDAGTNPAHQISPAWAYNRVSGGEDKGTWMEAVADVLNDWGAATMATMPYDETNLWYWGSEEAFREAPPHRSWEPVPLAYEGDVTIQNIKALLAEGIPVTFAMTSSNLHQFRDNFVLSSKEYSVGAADHAQTFVGYDDTIMEGGERGAFKVVNSWGTGFGDGGFYWLTYGAVKEIGASRALHLTYVRDQEDYEPTALLVWHFDGAPDQAATIEARAGTVALTPMYNQAQMAYRVQMPSFMLLDVSGMTAFPGQPFTLSVKGTCTISSLRMECYDHYAPGRPSMVSPISHDVPVSGSSNRAAAASAYAPAYAPVTLNDALDWAGPVVTGGTAGWTAVPFDPSAGGTAAQSGDIASGSSWMRTDLNGPAILTFEWGIDAMGYPDRLSLLIDGEEARHIEGAEAWRSVQISIPSGEHEIRWNYERLGAGGGIGVVDAVSWIPIDIHIDSDHELRDMAALMGQAGSGSEGSPIMISNLSIDLTGEDGLYFGNTTLHVLLSDVVLSGAEGEALHLHNVSNFSIMGSTFEGNGIGLRAQGSNAVMEGNRFIGNDVGIDIHGSGTVSGNLFMENKGHAVVARSSDWAIHLNAFVGNNGIAGSNDGTRAQADDLAGSSWSQGRQGNHWSDWTVDEDGDWYADSPYDVGISTDAHPYSAVASAPRVLSIDVSGSTAFLSWDLPGFFMIEPMGYEVERTGPDGAHHIASGPGDLVDGGLSERQLYEYRVRAISVLGAGSWSAPIEVLVPDTTPPELSILSPSNEAWSRSASVKVSWEGRDDGGIGRYEVRLDGAAFEDVGLSTSITFGGLGGGKHAVAVRAFDSAGNMVERTSSFRVDLTNPTIDIISPASGVIISSTVQVSIGASDQGSGVSTATVRLNGETYRGAEVVSFSVVLEDGTYIMSVTARDAAGNTASSQVTFTVASGAPSIRIISPSAGSLSSSSMIVNCSFDGPRETWAQVRIDGGEWHNITTTSYHEFAGLEDGAHLIEAVAWDILGVSATSSLSVTIDATPPSIVMEWVNGTVRISFSEAVDRNATVCDFPSRHEVRWDGGIMLIVPLAPLAVGVQHAFSVHAVDAHGNSVDRHFDLTIEAADAGGSPSRNDILLIGIALLVGFIALAALLLVGRK